MDLYSSVNLDQNNAIIEFIENVPNQTPNINNKILITDTFEYALFFFNFFLFIAPGIK